MLVRVFTHSFLFLFSFSSAAQILRFPPSFVPVSQQLTLIKPSTPDSTSSSSSSILSIPTHSSSAPTSFEPIDRSSSPTPLISAAPSSEPPAPSTDDHHSAGGLSMKAAVKTRQFWFLWFMFFINITAGISILSQLSAIFQELFGKTSSEAAGWISLISLANMIGRFLWATVSDWIGLLFLLSFVQFLLIMIVLSSLSGLR
jgi:hypothetical protein